MSKSPPSMRFPRAENSNCRRCRCNARHRWRRLSPNMRHGHQPAGPWRLACTCPCCCCSSGIVPCSRYRSKRRRPMNSESMCTRPPSRTYFQFRCLSSARRGPKTHSIHLWGKKQSYRPRGTFRCCQSHTNRSSRSSRSGWGKFHCHCKPTRACVDRRLCSSRPGTP